MSMDAHKEAQPGSATPATKLKGSVARVHQSALDQGLDIEIITMPSSTRTAEEAAAACNCQVGQIVKSLIFQRHDNENLILLLIAGDNQANLYAVANQIGSSLDRADPRRVRTETGFAIGGVAPIGHKTPMQVYMDPALLIHDVVWAAAGAPNAVFSVDPNALRETTGAELLIS